MGHEAYARRALREIKVLRLLGAHSNIVSLHDVMLTQIKKKQTDLYLVTDLMDSDLHHVVRQNELSTRHI